MFSRDFLASSLTLDVMTETVPRTHSPAKKKKKSLGFFPYWENFGPSFFFRLKEAGWEKNRRARLECRE